MKKKKVILIIRDGWGYSLEKYGNAVMEAKTPNNDDYIANYPTTILKCSGKWVGNPAGVMGGSEVGHLTLGAGRVVWQGQEIINRAIADGSFFENKALLSAVDNCRKNNSALHLMGLFSDAGVHSDLDHLIALMELAKKEGLDKVFIHLFLDGRDVEEKSALTILDRFEKDMTRIGVGKIASLIGRYYAMDRDLNWERTEMAFDLLVHRQGYGAENARQAIEMAYDRKVKSDYYVQATAIAGGEAIKAEDSLIFFNFRSDRARQLVAILKDLPLCPNKYHEYLSPLLVCMTSYDNNWDLPVAFEIEKIKNGLSEWLSKQGKRQLRVAETEKYAHVTFFFNGQIEEKFESEDRIMVNSPEVESYDLQPEMSAKEVADKVLENIGNYDFILVNFANADLVGHSGVFEAVVKACETVDEQVGRIVDKAIKNNYYVVVGADHGNAEHMLKENGVVDTSHGFNPVSFSVVGDKKDLEELELKSGGLANVAGLVLELMGVEKPEEMIK